MSMCWFGWYHRTACSSPTKAGTFSWGGRLPLILVVAATGAALSFLFFWLLRAQELRYAEEGFRHEAAERVEAVEKAMVDRLGTIHTLAAFYAGSELIDRKEFQTFVRPLLKRYPDIQALGWAPQIPASRRQAQEAAVRLAGFPKYEITERTDRGQFIRAAEHAEYYPVLFLEPLDAGKNKNMLGFDVLSNGECSATARRAIVEDRLAVGPCLPSAENGADRPRLHVAQPARYESPPAQSRPADQPSSNGLILGVIDVPALVKSALEPFTPLGIDMSISVPTSAGGHALFFMWHSRLSDGRSPSVLELEDRGEGVPQFTREIDLGGTRFRFDCVPLEDCLTRELTWAPLGMLLSGLLVTGLVVGYLILLAGRAARVERLVAERTLALSESEQRFHNLIENAGDAMFLYDESTKIVDVNQRACDSLGYTREELLSMAIPDIDLKVTTQSLARHWYPRPAHYPETFNGIERRKDGGTFPVEVRSTPLNIGGRRFMIGLARDVTERNRLQKTLEESEQKLRAILDHTYQFIGLMTPEGILMKANKSALAFSGVPEEEILGKLFWETPWWTHSPALQEELRDAVKRAAAGDFVRMEATHLAANGDLHWIDFSLKPVKDETGHVIFLIPEGRDVTEYKRMDEALRRERQSLRDLLDLHERDRKLVAYEIHDGLAQQLAGAIFKFQAFEQLRDSDPDAARAVFDDAIRAIREAMAETRRLIGDLRPPVFDELGVVAAVEYLITELRRQGGPEIEFVHPEEWERIATPLESAMFRVVQEGLTNACRYGQSEKVRVELRREGDRVHVEVRDWGIGFDPANIESGHYGIQGICERARLLGGTARIETAPGQGTRIHVELPVPAQTDARS